MEIRLSRKRTVLRTFFFLGIGGTFLLAVLPSDGVPGLHDKLKHAGAFALLFYLWLRGWGCDACRRGVLWLLGYAVLNEAVQSFLPWRTGEWPDVAADMAGVGVVALGAYIVRRFFGTVDPEAGS